MVSETLEPRASVDSFWPRPVQLVAAVPSFLLWSLLTGIAIVWYVGVAISTMSGRLASSGDWRFPYLMIMLLFVFAGAGVTARTQWRAWQGRSHLWWHVCSFVAGIVFLGLIGIVGD